MLIPFKWFLAIAAPIFGYFFGGEPGAGAGVVIDITLIAISIKIGI